MPTYAQVSDMPVKAVIDDEDFLHVKGAEDGIDYRMLGRLALQASEVSFDNSLTDLDSTNAQDAVDEVALGGTTGGLGYYKTTDAVIIPVGPGQKYPLLSQALRKYATRVSTNNLQQRKSGRSPLVILSLQPDYVWNENIVVSNVDLSHIRINQCMWGDILVSPTLTGKMLRVKNGAKGPAIGGVINFQGGTSTGIILEGNSKLSFGGQIGVLSQALMGTGYVLQNQEERKYFLDLYNCTQAPVLELTDGSTMVCDSLEPGSPSVDRGLKLRGCTYGAQIKSGSTLDLFGFRVKIEDSDFGITCATGNLYCNKYDFTGKSSGFLQPGLVLQDASNMYCGNIRIINNSAPFGMLVSGMSNVYTLEAVSGENLNSGYPDTSAGAGTITAFSIGIKVEDNCFVNMYLTQVSATNSSAIQISDQSEALFNSPVTLGAITLNGQNSSSAVKALRNSRVHFDNCVVNALNAYSNAGFEVQGFSLIRCTSPAYGLTTIPRMTLTTNGMLLFQDAETIVGPA